ncbi:MAG: c-type cytochrome [Vicinamibacterales bacterium]
MRQWIACGVVLLWVAAASSAAAQTTPRAAAAKMKNPVASSAASIDTGRQLYQKHCRMCHGATGAADTAAARSMGASSIVDATWTRGSSDGEIFVVIQEGAGPEYKMKGMKGKVSEQDTWHLVNYVRSLAAASK